MRVPIVPSPCQHCIVSDLNFGHCKGCVVVLHYCLNSLMTYAVEHLFTCLSSAYVLWWGFVCVFWLHQAVCGISVLWQGIEHCPWQWKCGVLTTEADSFFNGAIFLLLSFNSYLHIWGNSPLSDVSFANVFSCSVDCLFVLLTVSFAEQNLILSNPTDQCLLSWTVLLVLCLKTHHQNQGHSVLDFLLCHLLEVL